VVEVSAGSVYEAVAQALRIFRDVANGLLHVPYRNGWKTKTQAASRHIGDPQGAQGKLNRSCFLAAPSGLYVTAAYANCPFPALAHYPTQIESPST